MRRVAAAAIAGCAGLAACALHRMPGTAEPLSDARRGSRGFLQAGAARADVTPPPGPSTFGLGPDSLVTDGYWSRLYCRAFILETSPKDRVAIVGCDLHSVSGILHRRVAERVRAIVPTSRLFIAATHTHAGPAHYFDLTGPGISHAGNFGVQDWYRLNVVPTLGDGSMLANASILTVAQDPASIAGTVQLSR